MRRHQPNGDAASRYAQKQKVKARRAKKAQDRSRRMNGPELSLREANR